MSRYARVLTAGEEQHATALELFYDLVFVFAITQVSHLLLDDLTWRGAGRAALVLLVTWWAWNYTTWVTNELDPDSSVVRGVLIALMLASLLAGHAIPEAFGAHGLLFAASSVAIPDARGAHAVVLAASYVAIQVGTLPFLTFATATAGTGVAPRATPSGV